MENQVEEVKRKVDIVGLISESVQLKKAGRNYKGLCPFHSEKTPSFMVSPERQIFKCFGCGEGGDALAFIEKTEKVSFPEALKMLADRVGVKLRRGAPDPAEKQKEIFLKINGLTAELFHYLLTKHKQGKVALEYLKKRGLSNTSIDKFGLGYAPGLDSVISDFLRKKGFESRDLIASGVSLPSKIGTQPYDRFHNRIMFPIRDPQGKVLGFSGRALGETQPKYLNSPDNLTFNKGNCLFGIDLARAEISKGKTAVLVEGNLDVLSSHQAGTSIVVAPLGTALTENQVSLLRRFADNLILAFDTDSAGIAASKRAIELAENQGMAIKVVELGEYKDPDEMIKASPSEWKKSLEKAIPIYDFLIETSLKRWQGSGAEGKRKVVTELLPYLKSLTDPILREHYLDLLSARLGMGIETLQNLISPEGRVENQSTIEVMATKEPKLEEYLLALLLASERLDIKISENWFGKIETRDILSLLKETFEKEGKLKVKSILETLPAALSEKFDEVLLFDLDERLLTNSEALEKEILVTTQRLQKRLFHRQLKALSLQIKQAEAAREKERVGELSSKFRIISEQLSTLDQAS